MKNPKLDRRILRVNQGEKNRFNLTFVLVVTSW